jgi:hypothetical protein
MGKMRNAFKILVGKPEGKRPLGSPRHVYELLMHSFKISFKTFSI